MIGIYQIISPTGKRYIGQSWNIENRFKDYYRLHCKQQLKLYRSILKYGIETHVFEIIHELPMDINQKILDSYEQLYMDLYRNCDIELLNIREAGNCGKHSEKSKIVYLNKIVFYSKIT